MQYEAYGPFEVPRLSTGKMLDINEVRRRGQFWNSIESTHPGITFAKGTYIFGIRAGGGMTPHYIGQARSLRGFYGEVFSHRNCNNYNQIIHSKKGTPIVMLLARPKQRGSGFTKPSKHEIDFLEKMMIGIALAKNEDLLNIQHTRYLKEIVVPGVLGRFNRQKKMTAPQEALKSILGV